MIRESHPRQRPHLAFAVFVVVVLGLSSRAFPSLLPAALGQYPGDALWALMVFFGIAFIRPDLRPLRLAVLALAVSWLVELSQLYRAAWIDSLRATFPGHLVLGSRFQWPDIFSYAIGVSAGSILDALFFHRRTQPQSPPRSPFIEP